jgi:hypothetical protein
LFQPMLMQLCSNHCLQSLSIKQMKLCQKQNCYIKFQSFQSKPIKKFAKILTLIQALGTKWKQITIWLSPCKIFKFNHKWIVSGHATTNVVPCAKHGVNHNCQHSRNIVKLVEREKWQWRCLQTLHFDEQSNSTKSNGNSILSSPTL